MKVVLDARRQTDNGVARVTRLLALALSKEPIELILLGREAAIHQQFPGATVVAYDAALLSHYDLTGLDAVLRRIGADCFIAPQFYNSPYTDCPQVRLLHDTFPLEPDAFVTDIQAVEATFGRRALARVAEILLPRGYAAKSEWPRLLYRAYYDLSVTHATALLTVSEQSFDNLVRHYPSSAAKLRVLPLFPDPTIIGRSHCDMSSRPIDVLHVSKFEPRKNQVALLQALRAVRHKRPTLRSHIVGSPSTLFPEYTAELQSLIALGSSEGWLEHSHAIDDARLSRLYASARILAIPSHSEGFGLPALEGMANGCVIVAQPGTAVDEVCGPQVIHTGRSAASIAESIRNLLANKEELRVRSAASKERASEYTVDATRAVLHTSIAAATSRSS